MWTMSANANSRSDALLASFYTAAKKINAEFSVIPMLVGSLGLQQLIGEDLSPDDIDVGIPLSILSGKWDDLVKLMQSDGFELVDLHEKCFTKGDRSNPCAEGNISMSFCSIKGTDEFSAIPGLCEFAGMDITECPVLETNGAVYKIPTLNQYLAIYMKSRNDAYRKEKTSDKDRLKIDVIYKALNSRGTHRSVKHLADRLAEKIIACKAPIVVGLDPVIEKIPAAYFAPYDNSIDGTAAAVLDFNRDVIDAVCDMVPCVKPQIAFFELLGSAGVRAFEQTVRYAKEKGLLVIEDGKRNDIGNTADAYANGHLGRVRLKNTVTESPLAVDFLTVSPFLGEESLQPFIRVCKEENKGIFILVRTSNNGNRLVQDAKGANGATVSELLAHYVEENARASRGGSGYSAIGAVVGATYPREAAALRNIMKSAFFLVPGYGTQGGTANDILPCFNGDGLGAIVNSSRGILYACLPKLGENCSKENYRNAVRNAAIEMRQKIYGALRETYSKMVY